jgi:hypothetical protein
VLAGLVALVAPGCSSSPGAAALPEPEGGAEGSASEAGDEPAECVATSTCTQAPTPGQQCVTTMSATVVDGASKPVAGLPVFVCGTNLCSQPSKTAGDGTVDVSVCLPFAAPAMKVFSDPQWAPFASLLPAGGPSFSLGAVTVTALPATGAALASGSGTVTSAGVSLTLASATVTFDVEHPTPDSQLFRAVAVPGAALPQTLRGTVAAAWGLAPLNTKLAPAAALSLPNPSAWAAGAAVDFYVNGTDPAAQPPPAPWGGWGLLGTGAVSSDGATVVLAASQGGLAEIAMVGVKLH